MGGGPDLTGRRTRTSVAADVAATLVVLACRFVLGLVMSLGLIAVGPVAAGMTSTVVMSDSMSPGIHAGDVVVVRPLPARDTHVGQVVLVDDPNTPGRLRLHRLVGHDGKRLVLQGDANAQPDPTPIAPSAVHGVAFLRVPWIGLPMLWIRDGRPMLAATAAGLLGVAALTLAVLDGGSGRTGLRILRRLAKIVLRCRRIAVAGLVAVLIAAPTVHAHLPLAAASWAAFTATTRSSSNALATGTWCPALPTPSVTVAPAAPAAMAPQIAYSFAVTGLTEANVGTLGSGYTAKLSATSLRTSGTCTSGNSPSVTFKGGESILSTSPYPAGATGTQSLWFDATTAAGVLIDLGSSTGTTSGERQLYFTSGGGLAFAVRNGGATASCTVTTSVSTGTWHFAAVVYNSTAKSFTLYYDGQSTSCTKAFTSVPSGNLYTRIGNDGAFASDASSGPYAGSIDEVYSWGGTMTGSGVDTVYAGGH